MKPYIDISLCVPYFVVSANFLVPTLQDLMSVSNSQTIGGSLLPSFRRKFLPAIGLLSTTLLFYILLMLSRVTYLIDNSLFCLLQLLKQTCWSRYQVGVPRVDESNASRSSEGAVEETRQLEPLADSTNLTLALEVETRQLEPLVDGTKQKLPLEEEPRQVEPLAEKKPKNGYTVSPVNRAACTANEILPVLQSLLVQNDIQRVCCLFLMLLVDMLYIYLTLTLYMFLISWQEKVIRLIRFFDRTAGNVSHLY